MVTRKTPVPVHEMCSGTLVWVMVEGVLGSNTNAENYYHPSGITDETYKIATILEGIGNQEKVAEKSK